MGTVRNDQADLAEARSSTYALLAAVFRTVPDSALLSKLRSIDLDRVIAELGAIPEEKLLPDLLEGQLVEDLAVEYTRLFIGPGPRISLYESVHADAGGKSEAAMWSERTARVKSFIEASGLHYADDFNDIPDHLSAELEFMHMLARHEALALRSCDEREAAVLHHIQRRFFDEHVGDWAPTFCGKVIAHAELPFYRGFAEILKNVIEFERELFDAEAMDRGVTAHGVSADVEAVPVGSANQ